MCVAAIALNAHSDWRLVAVGNRDEFHSRPALPLDRWSDDSGIIAGRDLKAGGTWLGVSEEGRFALLTNFRDPVGYRSDRASRGGLVAEYLSGTPRAKIAEMNAFNLFYADEHGAQFVTNYPEAKSEQLTAGIYGFSNGPLHKPWPKTRQLSAAVHKWLYSASDDFSPLFQALRAETPRPEHSVTFDLPAPRHAPVFIRGSLYGTRCSTVVAVTRENRGTIIERSFSPEGAEIDKRRIDFEWPG